MMTELTADETLVKQFQVSGEMKYFNELVSRHLRKVRSMIYPLVFNNADADDLTQEVFLRVIKGLDRFRGGASFATWLYRITMNTTNGFLRQRSRWKQEPDVEPAEQADTAANPLEALAGVEEDTAIGRALEALVPTLRSAIVLTAIQGLSVKEAAAADGCLAATMYWRVHEGRKQLKRILNI
jgi:RNA polymerase sigma-70 factor (ECF subfamily)